MEAPKQPSVLLMGLLYAFFSSTMMIFNKGALGVFPFPLQLTSLQYFVSGAAVYVLAHVKVLEAEGLRWGTIRKFWFVSAVFTLAIFSNTRVLHVASVETVIVFRTTVALLTAVSVTATAQVVDVGAVRIQLCTPEIVRVLAAGSSAVS